MNQNVTALHSAKSDRLLAPSRQMRVVQPPAAKQPTHLAGLRTALHLLKDPQPILRGELRRVGLATTSGSVRGSGSGVGLALPARRASSLRSSTPRAGTELSFNVIGSLLRSSVFTPHRSTVIPKDPGVSVMLAERGGGATSTQG